MENSQIKIEFFVGKSKSNTVKSTVMKEKTKKTIEIAPTVVNYRMASIYGNTDRMRGQVCHCTGMALLRNRQVKGLHIRLSLEKKAPSSFSSQALYFPTPASPI